MSAEPKLGESEPDLYSFVRERHEFRIRDRVVPSVTQVLQRAGLIRWYCNREQLDTAARLGHEVHMVLADVDSMSVNFQPYWTAALEGYVGAWAKFKTEWQFIPDRIEHTIYNRLYQYAGRLDRTGTCFGGSYRECKAVVEIKTGSIAAWHAEQLAGYALCMFPDDPLRLAVYLRPDGTYTVRCHDSIDDVQNFTCALAVTKLRMQRGLVCDDDAFDIVLRDLQEEFRPG